VCGDTNVARIGERLLLMSTQQGMRLRYIRHVGRRANHTVDQARIGIDANVGFHPKMPFVSLREIVRAEVFEKKSLVIIPAFSLDPADTHLRLLEFKF
jgi:hypothetical protein